MNNIRAFLIKDLGYRMCIEEASRKEILKCMDEFIDDLKYDELSSSVDHFTIYYKDGTMDFIGDGYDGHHIKRQHIASIVYENPRIDKVYGNFEINEYGKISPTLTETILHQNITEIPYVKYLLMSL